ncbi:hypothetical protein [Nocardia wallacei]|uniref:hypothetical protein n=1 Tax=Nocardia wallacei TaxID=480035 RepID=UPI0024581ACE|nr:hypothetical protein [Nocardia wallacei]
MTVSGAPLWRAVAYLASLPVSSTEHRVVARGLLTAPLEVWARRITHMRLAYREGPVYEACTAVEQILRDMPAVQP